MSRASLTYKELPPNSKKGCAVEACKKYADYEAVYGKKNGLRFSQISARAGQP